MSKIGEVYRIRYSDEDRYFQFVSQDLTQLNSDVIAVFNYKGSSNTNFDDELINKILNSGIEFFTHTTVNAGIKKKLWDKIGKAKVSDTSGALFKDVYYKDGLPDIEPFESDSYHSWIIWSINGEWQHIGSDIRQYSNAELGGVYPPDEIVYRIENGHYSGVPYYGQTR